MAMLCQGKKCVCLHVRVILLLLSTLNEWSWKDYRYLMFHPLISLFISAFHWFCGGQFAVMWLIIGAILLHLIDGFLFKNQFLFYGEQFLLLIWGSGNIFLVVLILFWLLSPPSMRISFCSCSDRQQKGHMLRHLWIREGDLNIHQYSLLSPPASPAPQQGAGKSLNVLCSEDL